MIYLPLSQGQFAVIEENDADLAQFKWSFYKNRSGNTYAVRKVYENGKQKLIMLHRVIAERINVLPLSHQHFVDHKNGNGLENYRSNLRLCSAAENQRNRRVMKNTASGLKGVFPTKSPKNPWGAHIRVDGKLKHLGVFPTLEDAHDAYCEAAQEHFGEFWRAA